VPFSALLRYGFLVFTQLLPSAFRSIDSLLTALEAKLQDKPEEKENLERQVTLTGEERSASQLNAEEKEEPDMTKVTPAANPPSVDASVSEPKRVSSQISSRVTLRASLPKTSRSMNPICVLYEFLPFCSNSFSKLHRHIFIFQI